ncbi:NAD(P)-dependent oxidoreductase [Nocardia sp. ET3-3]|uniref:NAD(P)-dependent oxidoreductase n=1 Tax=Nocardia terrae TaxID=2675851 RepID=A0A7K1UUP2_9NOCA|nr:NAD(P)-dependent oxidoreductase [Nocardia terrae]MVU78070.1 NAD(P)-dependent oxidoreductase [Nocardia terrae]
MIAFIGLGGMGAPMAKRLLDNGIDVTVWNRTPERAKPFGDRAASSVIEAVQGADIVITMLSDPAAVRDVIDQIADHLGPETTLIDMSSIGPKATADIAKQVPALVDAPVMGSVDRAGTGELIIFAGGDISGVSPVLEILGTVVPAGPTGAGAALKSVMISAIIAGVTVVGEAYALAGKLGLPTELVDRVMATGPLGGLYARATSDTALFPVRLAVKDVDLALSTLDQPVLAAARTALLSDPTLADQDLRAVVDTHRNAG